MAEDVLRLRTIRATSVDELEDDSYLIHAQIPRDPIKEAEVPPRAQNYPDADPESSGKVEVENA